MKTSGILLLVLLAVVVIVGGALLLSNNSNNSSLTGQAINTQAQNSTNTQLPMASTSSSTTQVQAPTGPNNISIQSFAFSPDTLTINVGDTVTWTNLDAVAHTVVSDSGSEISSPSLSQGQSYSHTFATAGTYTYHCSIHLQMKGTIIVQSKLGSSSRSSGSGSGGY